MLNAVNGQCEDKIFDECGVVGCVSKSGASLEVASCVALGLIGLQHRGQESSGIVTSGYPSEKSFLHRKGMGLVSGIFNPENLEKLKGVAGIGHNRYSTKGKSELLNCQPFVVNMQYGPMAVAHNGELVNKDSLRKEVLDRGVGLSTSSDSELITQILCLPCESEKNTIDIPERIKGLMKRSPTSYSLVVLYGEAVYAARDPYGNRPLCIGEIQSPPTTLNYTNGDTSMKRETEGWVVSSESCVFQSLGAVFVRDVKPGEVVCIDQHGYKSMGSIIIRPDDSKYSAFCIFEYIYFSRVDTVYQGNTVYNARRNSGIMLAIEWPVQADFVSTVPESATPAAIGFSRQSGIPYEDVLAKNLYIGRTFIKPTQKLRKLAVEQKFGVIRDNVMNRRIVLVDDSIVRGNTMQSIIKMLRRGGAAEIHVRIASPPVKNPCFMGINIPNPNELLANHTSLSEIPAYLGADSVKYLSLHGLLKAVQGPAFEHGTVKKDLNEDESLNAKNGVGHCTACLTGNYPTKLEW